MPITSRCSAAPRTEMLCRMLVERHLARPDRPADDPVDALVTRMLADHQLDENGLRAIDAEARRRAARRPASAQRG